MSFTAISFGVFVLLTCFLYFLSPRRFRWMILLAASYIFYWLCSNWLIIFVVMTTISTFFFAKVIGKINDVYLLEKDFIDKNCRKIRKKKDTIRKRWLMALCLVLNLGLLAILKLNSVYLEINPLWEISPVAAAFIMPVGISFYTLQAMGYLIDVQRGKYKPDTNIARFALFLSFFPQIVQGPIGRHDDLAKQLYIPHSFDFERIKNGILLIAYGLMKKLIIADRALVLVQNVFQGSAVNSGSVIFFGGLVFGLQMYCDFSGGIDIARGVAQIFGITLAENFKRPYFSQSISEYWRRWHITLGSWMRDYLFYPVLMSKSMQQFSKRIQAKRGVLWARSISTSLTSILVFLMVGLWHGMAWKYVAYGMWNGLLIAGETILKPGTDKMAAKLKFKTNCFSWKLMFAIVTLILMTFARYFLVSPNLTYALQNFQHTLFHFEVMNWFDGSLGLLGLSAKDFVILGVGVVALLIVGILQEKGYGLRRGLARQNIWFRWGVYLTIIVLLLLFTANNETAAGFVYAQF